MATARFGRSRECQNGSRDSIEARESTGYSWYVKSDGCISRTCNQDLQSLVNNAGIATKSSEMTSAGFDMVMGVKYVTGFRFRGNKLIYQVIWHIFSSQSIFCLS